MEAVPIFRRDVIRHVKDRWMSQYKDYADTQRLRWADKTAGDVRRELSALDPETASVSDVDAAIGTTGWGSLRCDFCGEDHEQLLRLGDQLMDYDSRWVDICPDCLRSALKVQRTSQTGRKRNLMQK